MREIISLVIVATLLVGGVVVIAREFHPRKCKWCKKPLLHNQVTICDAPDCRSSQEWRQVNST